MKIAVIPDIQAKPRENLEHCTWISRHLQEKRPDVTVILGDLWDFPSLSSFDKGKKSMEGRRISLDFAAGVEALSRLSVGLGGRKVFLEGNHEERCGRFLQDNPQMDVLPDVRSAVKGLGWEYHPFLKPVRIGGIAFAHIFPKNSTGRVTSGSLRIGPPSALAMIRANMESCIMGHRQGLETAIYHAGRRTYRGIIAGSCYRHNESYLGPEQNYWRGILWLNDVRQGNFNLTEVSLAYLQRKYGKSSN